MDKSESTTNSIVFETALGLENAEYCHQFDYCSVTRNNILTFDRARVMLDYPNELRGYYFDYSSFSSKFRDQ